ncbi:MAG: hypothetical protein OXJ52_09350 [Oligoflexia bacterium]|nr:hypothetical protein [Oligoflexia bacterium]
MTKIFFIRILIDIFLLLIFGICFYFGFTSDYLYFYPTIKYRPLEHCYLKKNKLECQLDPCETNCKYTYNWESYKKEKEPIFILTNPQYTKQLNQTKSFCNQRSSYCHPIDGWYEEGHIKIKKQSNGLSVKDFLQSLIFTIPSTREFTKNFCKLKKESM